MNRQLIPITVLSITIYHGLSPITNYPLFNPKQVLSQTITPNCGYTVTIPFSDRDAFVTYIGITETNHSKKTTCRPIGLTISDRQLNATVQPTTIGLYHWQWNELAGKANSYAEAIAALPATALEYLNPSHSRVIELWGF